jgi:D-psicose/D-tagatose/L-ribulose 3-epimerase
VGAVGNPLGIHFNVWTPGWSEDEARIAVAQTKEAGYDFLEISIFDAATFDASMTRRVLDDAGLRATCGTALNFDNDVSSADDGIAERGVEYLLHCLELAAEVGSEWLVGLTYSAWGKYGAPPSAAGRANCAAALARVCRRAAELGIDVGLEVLNRYETNLLNTAAQARQLIADVDEPNLWIQLDSFHANIEETGQSDAVEQCDGRLGYLHVGESHRGALGSGTVDLPGLFRGVTAAGFAGPIAFEAFSLNAVGREHGSVLGVWRDLWEDSAAMAKHARVYIEEQLAAAQAVTFTSARATEPVN